MASQPGRGKRLASSSPQAPHPSVGTAVCASCRGLPSQAFEYIRYNKGIMGEDTYPYKGQVTGQPGLHLLGLQGSCLRC